MGNEIVPYSDRRGLSYSGKREVRHAAESAIAQHLREGAAQNSDYALNQARTQQTYNLLDAAMSRSASSHRLMHDLADASGDEELRVALSGMKRMTDAAVAFRVSDFARGD